MSVLIVVDMLKDFCYVGEDRPLAFPAAQEIIPFVAEKVKESQGPSIFLADNHAPDDKEFDRFPAHAIKGTDGSSVVDELEFNALDFYVPKTRYSGFFKTNLEHILWDLKPERVDVVGVCTSICVMDTVGGLANRDYKIRVYKDGVADFDPDMHNFALKRMEALYGAEIV